MRTQEPPPSFDLPIVLARLTPEQVTWLAAISAQTGMSTADCVRELLANAAELAGFPRTSPKAA